MKQVVQNEPEHVHKTIQLVTRDGDKNNSAFIRGYFNFFSSCIIVLFLLALCLHFSTFHHGCHCIPLNNFIISSFLFLLEQSNGWHVFLHFLFWVDIDDVCSSVWKFCRHLFYSQKKGCHPAHSAPWRAISHHWSRWPHSLSNCQGNPSAGLAEIIIHSPRNLDGNSPMGSMSPRSHSQDSPSHLCQLKTLSWHFQMFCLDYLQIKIPSQVVIFHSNSNRYIPILMIY